MTGQYLITAVNLNLIRDKYIKYKKYLPDWIKVLWRKKTDALNRSLCWEPQLQHYFKMSNLKMERNTYDGQQNAFYDQSLENDPIKLDTRPINR